jgi:hypothetical protein
VMKVTGLFGCRGTKPGSGGRLRPVVRTGKRATAVRIEIDCGSDPAGMSGAWPAYRKLRRGRSRSGAGNRVRKRVLDSRAKLAGAGNGHPRRRRGNVISDELKK